MAAAREGASEGSYGSHARRLDIDAYLRRVGYAGDLSPTRPTLEALHLAHATHIPFENIDIGLGLPIRLDLDSIQAKLVVGRRGGYCYEHNLLFAAVLEALGFSLTRLAARVRHATTVVLPRTHMMFTVDVEDGRFLADVGFGADGLLLPVPFGASQSRQYAWSYRVVPEGRLHVLQSLSEATWSDIYAFSDEPQCLADYELASYYTSTNPASGFVKRLTAQRLSPELRRALRDREYVEDNGTQVLRRTLADDDEVLDVLRESFDLAFPRGTRFRYRR